MTDFRALFAAAEQNLDVNAFQSLAEGWAEVAEAAPPISCTDVYTGLATPAHFQRRIHELSTFGSDSPAGHALAIITISGPSDSRCHRWTVLAKLGETIDHQLRGTGAVAMFQNSAVHVLFPVNEQNMSRLMDCKTATEAVAGGILAPARMKFYPLSTVALTRATASTRQRDKEAN